MCLDRLGFRKRCVPEVLGHAFVTPLLAELTRRHQSRTHTFRSALREQFSTGFVNSLWHLGISDEEIPLGADRASLFADGAGVEVGAYGLVLILVFHSELNPRESESIHYEKLV